MSATHKILTSLHGRLCGISKTKKLVVNGRTCVTQDDTGAQMLISPAPTAFNATGTLTAANILGGVITSTTAAAVVATLPTGTLTDAAAVLGTNEAFEFVVINTGAANTFTIAAGTGHTVVGNMVVALSTSAIFRTQKTAANTFVTYRIG